MSKLFAPNGKEIVGTDEVLMGTQEILHVRRETPVSLYFEWGETEDHPEGQESRVDHRGVRLFVDDDCDIWPEDLLHFEGEEPAEEEVVIAWRQAFIRHDAAKKAAGKLLFAAEAALHWLTEEAANPGETKPDEILRVLQEAIEAAK